MSSLASQRKTPACTGADLPERGPLSLPVLADHEPRGKIRRSRNARRRAIVLAVVQGLLIVHIGLWLLSRQLGWLGGATTTPIEPSEAMEFTKHGIVNVGLIFFALALLSTLVLGRWFCGWGCHVVLLQDLCGWIMKKLGVRPRPFRSRLLVYVPLILACYMFLWPAAYRMGLWVGRELGWIESSVAPWAVSWHLTTTDFWKTFAGVAVAIPFLAVCGFATVYFLGAKGFCTYGCPYGGFFAPLDLAAPGRIRVTDACEQCGHCTAVCTSNVRVHEEVREYGMVVDPGCMKCGDCMSVCPKDALYFGFGKPALAKGEARTAAPKRRFDLSMREELVLFGLFWLVFWAVRDIYNVVPMLMAAGIAGCVTFLAWKLWRLLRDTNVTLHRFQLKLRGGLQPAGRVYAVAVVALLAITAHSGAVNSMRFLGWWNARAVDVDTSLLFSETPPLIDGPTRAAAERSARFYGLASGMRHGGIGLAGNLNVDYGRATMLCILGRFDEAEAVFRRAGRHERISRDIAFLLRGTGRDEEALAHYREVLGAERGYHAMLEEMIVWCGETGRVEAAYELCRQRRERFPHDGPTLRWLSLLAMETGRTDEGVALLTQRVDERPRDVEARLQLGLALGQTGDIEGGLAQTRRAVELAPERLDATLQLAGMLEALGRLDECLPHARRAVELAPDNPQTHFQMARVLDRLGRRDEALRHLETGRGLLESR